MIKLISIILGLGMLISSFVSGNSNPVFVTTIFFQKGATEIEAKEKEKLDAFIRLAQKEKVKIEEIAGYAHIIEFDDSPNKEEGEKLATARVESVFGYLRLKGVKKKRRIVFTSTFNQYYGVVPHPCFRIAESKNEVSEKCKRFLQSLSKVEVSYHK